MVTCSVYGCTSQYAKYSRISFHKFPDDPELKKKWIVFTKRKKFVPTVNSKLCSKHFSKDQFRSGSKWSCVLKLDAVPIISHFPPHLQESPPKMKSTVKQIQQTTVQKKVQTTSAKYPATMIQSSNSIMQTDPIEISSSSSVCEEEGLPCDPEKEDLTCETEEDPEEEDLPYEPEEEDINCEPEEEDLPCLPEKEGLPFEPEEEDLPCEPEEEDLSYEPEEEDIHCEPEDEDLSCEPTTATCHCTVDSKKCPELLKKKNLQKKVKQLQMRLKRRDAKVESLKSVVHTLKEELKMVETQNRIAKSSKKNKHTQTIRMKNSDEEPIFKPIKFLCDQCGRQFLFRRNLKRHIDAVHCPWSVRYSSHKAELVYSPKPFKCGICSSAFRQAGGLKYHERKTHKIGNPIKCRPKNMSCPICNFNASGVNSVKTIYGHFKDVHNIDIKEETLHFDSLEKFYEWKKDTENKTSSFFCKAYTKLPMLLYRCRRFGKYKQNQNNMGSCRFIGFCPARMKVKILENQSVFVLYTADHVGHQNDLEHLRLRTEKRRQIATQLAKKMPREKILKGTRGTLTNSSKTKETINKSNNNDITIQRTFSLNIESTKHPFVPGNIEVWVQELNMSKNTDSLADEEEIVEQPIIVEEVPYEDTDITEITFEVSNHEGMPTSNQSEEEKITEECENKSKCLGTIEDIKWFRSYLR